jgi:hypothetical protein
MNQRSYNPNTKYGRRKNRERAAYNYQNGTPEYRQSIDEMTGCFYMGLIIFIIILFVVVAKTCGTDTAVRMLK